MNYQPPFGGPPAMDPYGMMPPPPVDYSYLGPPQFQPNPTPFDLSSASAKPLPLIPPGAHGGGPATNNTFRLGRASINTNSKDPTAMKSRVFVGNLNTNLVTREQLHQVFAPFGEILAISLHKGYAFLQFGYENEARNAVNFTDGTMIAGKRIDVNVASEPKATGDVPSGINKRSANVTIPLGVVPEPKRQKVSAGVIRSSSTSSDTAPKKISSLSSISNMMLDGGGKLVNLGTKHQNKVHHVNAQPIMDSGLKREALEKGDDIIICGQCRHLFSSIDNFSTHKQTDSCFAPTTLVATVVTQTSTSQTTTNDNDTTTGTASATATNGGESTKLVPKSVTPSNNNVVEKAEGEPEIIQCFICHDSFDRSWNLLVHISQNHNMTVYEVPNEKNDSAVSTKSESKTLF